MHNQDIGIVIVTWNGWSMLGPCLESVFKQTVAERIRVVVVDNGSTDGTLNGVRVQFPEVTLISLPTNTGFASPNNIGIHSLLSDRAIQYIITLNNDITLDPAFVEQMVVCSMQHTDAGSIQGRLYRSYEDNLLDCVGMLIAPDMSAMNRGQCQPANGHYTVEEEIFGPSASAALYTRTALERVRVNTNDYFDPYYFAYYEDVQLAWKLRLAGFTSWYTPSAVAFHAHSATGKSHSPFKAYHIHRNQYCNIVTLLPTPLLVVALLLMPLRYVLLLTSVLIRRGPSAQLSQQTSKQSARESLPHIVLRGWHDVWSHRQLLMHTRRSIQQRRVVYLRTIVRWLRKYPANICAMIFG